MEAQSAPSLAERYDLQSHRLSHLAPANETASSGSTAAVKAVFITPQDPVIQLANGGRLPAVSTQEATKLNILKKESQREAENDCSDTPYRLETPNSRNRKEDSSARLDIAVPPSRTNPLFPPLPLYGPPSLIRNIQCISFRVTSFFLSLAFLSVIILGAIFTSIPLMLRHVFIRLTFRDPNAKRPFYAEEQRKKRQRREEETIWRKQKRRRNNTESRSDGNEEEAGDEEEYIPTEGGKDPLICDIAYYARRVGLNAEEFKVQTEDGFLISLWHLFNPRKYRSLSPDKRRHRTPELFSLPSADIRTETPIWRSNQRYPVLGFDVWLGNNRCGFKPEHTQLKYSDPRMWAWNIRQMGVLDLPALVSRVLFETGFSKLGLVCHSQGTTEALVALAKEQRPDMGQHISVFCGLAPAAYAGPLIGKMYFKFMRVISPGMFRLMFGLHSFIPFMMTMHSMLPGRLYGMLGYRVFSFLFDWTDERWDRDLRNRMFQYSPVYVSSESMRWWLGRECFARHKCILSTREQEKVEDQEDEQGVKRQNSQSSDEGESDSEGNKRKPSGSSSWYNEQVPPFALWVAGSDKLVDGKKLIKRFQNGREPHVRLVHAKVIEEYEHLDVIWAMDSIEKVGVEVRDVLWKSVPLEVREICQTPKGCESIDPW
ncbi:MAG: hypothetical protein M1829_002367 [Trizodia sp. TS-e1964]|nr:MAG: hypothetical protein M1829_002367 [Trizodia sp. TS-e1964]